ncbi:hypothetical protein THIOM_004133 [Candidatus Thiomargarita nelsonii]|uniref:Uncharacterized protein n=1 Tax=Candidatus Thiomargarita nelsonii TaxID=1003181 RepID=A0A176RWU9_9GAMM|nr:hypothetical protein THIOM_004133 [Candidatus Thiomargarita nelsonii]
MFRHKHINVDVSPSVPHIHFYGLTLNTTEIKVVHNLDECIVQVRHSIISLT